MSQRWTKTSIAVGIAACCLASPAFGEETAPVPVSIQFVDVAEEVGLTFRHDPGVATPKVLVESLSGGGGWLDYDGDGLLDVYLVNGARLGGDADAEPLRNVLYRQTEDGTFVDVTAAAGVGDTGYGYGCAFGDYDSDGDTDLYVTNYGKNVLYRNNGDGTFAEATGAAVSGDANHWSTSALWVDVDTDGDLDLYVANYLDFDVNHGIPCSQEGVRTLCTPREFGSQTDLFFRNNGDGTFEEAAKAYGLHETIGKGLGVIASDYDADGDLDLYVANDLTQNLLFRNTGGGKFEEVSLYSGVGFNEDGFAESGMGLTVGDVDGDADLDMFVTNFQNETNTLYANLGRSFFLDQTFVAGLGTSSLLYLAFGTGFVDVDHDGDLDLFAANGHIEPAIEQVDETATYRQTNQLWINDGAGAFKDRATEFGPAFTAAHISRAAAFADYDSDGDIDILVVNNNGPVELYRNDGGHAAGNWFGLDVRLGEARHPAEGARIMTTVGDKQILREVRVGSSYLAQNDPRVLIGIGDAERPDSVVITWPGGGTHPVEDVHMGAYTVVDLTQPVSATPASAPASN